MKTNPEEPQYFSYTPDDGFTFHASREEAIKECRNAFTNAEDEAGGDGWPEETENICWGVVSQRATVTERHKRPPESELDENGDDAEGRGWRDWNEIIEMELLPALNALAE